MKDFIYLDTDYLTSYLAQINSGNIIQRIVSEFEGNESVTEEGTPTVETLTEESGEIKGGIPALANGTASFTRSKTKTSPLQKMSFTDFEFGKKLVSKTMHDDAYEELQAYLLENGMIKNEIGGFYLEKIPFNIVDFEFFKSLFSNKFMQKSMSSLLSENQKKILTLENQLAHTPQRDKQTDIKKKIALLKKGQNDFSVLDVLDTLIEITPTSCFLINRHALIPLKPEFLRDGYKSSLFKYSGEVNVLGKVTKKITSKEPAELGAFDIGSIIDSMVLSIASEFLSLKEVEPFVISPVAIFFE